MKINLDASLLLEEEKTGIGWCAQNIIKELSYDKENEYRLNLFSKGSGQEQLEKIKKYEEMGFAINKCRWFHYFLYRLSDMFFPLPYYLFFGRADITIFFNYIVPWKVRSKTITFVYDMAYKAHPETLRDRTLMILKKSLKKSCKRADYIITISKFSKREIIKYLNINPEKIIVMPVGVDLTLYHPDYSKVDIDKVKGKYNIDSDYLLYLGTIEPRKNLERLVEAYGLAKKQNENIPKLVMAGRKGWLYDSIFERVKSLDLTEDIIFTGYIDAKDAPILLCGALIFLFPSLYEGFGMPPLEAMACKTPVIVSSSSALPEVVKDAGEYVDPLDVKSIARAIDDLVKNEKKRSQLAEKGYKRAKNFTWKNSAKILQDVFQSLDG